MEIVKFKKSEAELWQEFLGYKVFRVIVDGRVEEKYRYKTTALFACSSLRHKQIYVYDEFFKLPTECQEIVMLHEVCHVKYNTINEKFCDKFAVEHLENGEYWLKRTRELIDYHKPMIKTKLGIK